MVCGERFLDGLALARQQIDIKLVAKHDEVAPGLMITLGKLGNQLLDAGLGHGHGPLPFTLLELDLLVERTLECRLQIRRHWLRLAFGTLRVATLPGFELIFFGRTARTDLVLWLGRLGWRGGRIGTAVIVVFLLCSDMSLFFSFLCDQAAALARCSAVVSKVSLEPARIADLPA
jgi:hypothetical protein